MAVAQVTQVNDRDFDQTVLSDPSPVLVEFYAPWCPHCRRMAPVIAELAGEFAGRVRIVQVNADENRDLLQRFQIRGVPTFVVYANGEEMDRFVGEVSRQTLTDRLNDARAQADRLLQASPAGQGSAGQPV